jgi:exonuclease III
MGVTSNRNKLGNLSQVKSFVIYHQNIRSIKKKKKELTIFLNDECNNPDIICISEHHLSASELSTFSMTEYKRATGFSHSICKNGEVCILVKDSILYQELDLSKLSMEKIFEACAVKITLNKRKLCVLCLYRAPDGDLNQFIEQLESTLLYLGSTKSELIISGDTNINYHINPLRTAGWEKILQPGRQGCLNARRVTTEAVLLKKVGATRA